jgi:hypothetical protein
MTLNAETRHRTRWKQAILSVSRTDSSRGEHASPKDADMIVCVTTSFFAVEILGFFALNDDPILG